MKEKNRKEIELLASELGNDIEREFEHLADEISKGYEKEDALFLLLSFFKKMKRIANEKFEGKKLEIFENRLKNAFIKAAFNFGIKKKELGHYLKELGIRKKQVYMDKEDQKREELEKIRKAITLEEAKKKLKPVRTKKAIRKEIEIDSTTFLLLLLLILLLLFLIIRLI